MLDGPNWHDVEFGQIELEFTGSRQRDIVAASEVSTAFEAIIAVEDPKDPGWKARAEASGRAAIAGWERFNEWQQESAGLEKLEDIEWFHGSARAKELLAKVFSHSGYAFVVKALAPQLSHWPEKS